VRKIKEVISSRMAAKVNELAKKDRKEFGRVWEDIHTFVKFGMMRDEKFFDKVKDQVIYRSTGESEYVTLPEYLERARERHENKVFYTNDETAQTTYLKLFKSQGLEALILDTPIDSHFIQYLEMKNPEVRFERVDSDVTENLIEDDQTKKLVEKEGEKSVEERIKGTFESGLHKEGLTIRVESLKDASVPGMILLSEQSRRFKEMTRMMGQDAGDLFKDHTLLVNSASPVVKNLLRMEEAGRTDEAGMLVEQIYDLAMLTHQAFDKERMESFLERSNRILEVLSQK
jgi:molecular chaperone HtpG